MEAVGCGGGVLVSNNCFFYNKTQQHHFWNFILMTQCKLYMRSGGSHQRQVADGADVVFTDTGWILLHVSAENYGKLGLRFGWDEWRFMGAILCVLAKSVTLILGWYSHFYAYG